LGLQSGKRMRELSNTNKKFLQFRTSELFEFQSFLLSRRRVFIGLHSLRCGNVNTLTSEAGTSTHDVELILLCLIC
jgi:hypothetical protein